MEITVQYSTVQYSSANLSSYPGGWRASSRIFYLEIPNMVGRDGTLYCPEKNTELYCAVESTVQHRDRYSEE
jgi:hypothetical protein